MKRADWHSKLACEQARRRVRVDENQRCIRILRDELRGRVERGVVERIVERMLNSRDAALTSSEEPKR